jgi:amino acid transporter
MSESMQKEFFTRSGSHETLLVHSFCGLRERRLWGKYSPPQSPHEKRELAGVVMAADRDKMGYWSVVAIGVGGMVGGGIFAVLGLSVQMTRGGAPLAFLIAGAVALITSYSYARLSVTYPSQGGTVTFLDQAFGPGLFTGTINTLLWISYIVMLSLYSYAFGSYGAALFSQGSQTLWKHVLTSGSIVGIMALNLLSARVIGEAEEWIVAIKVTILLLFVAVGAWSIDGFRLAPAQWASSLHIIAGGMIIFLAYEGFELIANTAADVRTPATTLPRAYYSTMGFVIFLYVLVAAVTIGNLSVGKIVGAKDYALGEAARPFLGRSGYLMITIAALLSTASAINATLYGAARLSFIIAKDGELPEGLERKVWNAPVEGLLITAAATLVIANLFDLSSISTMGSAGFLLIFACVNGANVVLAKETKSCRCIPALGVVLCLGALGTLLWQTLQKDPSRLWVLFAMIGLAFLVEIAYRVMKSRNLRLSHQR